MQRIPFSCFVRSLRRAAIATTLLVWPTAAVAQTPPPVAEPPAPTRLAPPADERSLDELATLYANTAVWGTGAGVTVRFAKRWDSSAPAFFVPAVGASLVGAGIVAALDLSGRRRLRYGVPASITAGLWIGMEAGLFTAAMVDGFGHGEPITRGFPPIVWSAATAGALAGGIVGDLVGTTPGRASMTLSGAFWGGALPMLAAIGACPSHTDCLNKVPWSVGLLGATLGAVGGGLLGRASEPSIWRVRVIDVGAFAGAGMGLAIYMPFTGGRLGSLDVDPRLLSLACSIGATAGLVTAAILTRNLEHGEPPRARRSALASIRPTLLPLPQGI
jgi:hypothetical protein